MLNHILTHGAEYIVVEISPSLPPSLPPSPQGLDYNAKQKTGTNLIIKVEEGDFVLFEEFVIVLGQVTDPQLMSVKVGRRKTMSMLFKCNKSVIMRLKIG